MSLVRKVIVWISLYMLVLGLKCNIEDSLNFFHLYREAALLIREYQEKPVTKENVTYYLYSKYNPEGYIKLDDDNLDSLQNKRIVFFIHGWWSSKEDEWYENLKNVFLKKFSDYNVVQVDWEEAANAVYYVAAISTSDVAKIVAQLIIDLIKNHGVNLGDIILIGHSLGGHIAGLAGKEIYNVTGNKLSRIVALDPAGPLFTERTDDMRLNQHDAKVVEVVHSNGGLFGYEKAIGTIDFFPNGGNFQPGCKDIDSFNVSSLTNKLYCDHVKASEYFADAILEPKKFVATRCTNWEAYRAGECNKNEKVLLGNITTKSLGSFFLDTNTKQGTVINSVLNFFGL